MSWKITLEQPSLAPQAPPGVHPAVCVALVDIGTHSRLYKGKARDARQMVIVWELTDTENADKPGEPVFAYAELTQSFNEKSNLRAFVEGRTSRRLPESGDYDVLLELGQPCMLTVLSDGQYSNVESVSAPYRGMTVPPPHVEPFVYMVDPRIQIDIHVFPGWLPHIYGKSVRQKIMMSKEVTAMMNEQAKKPTSDIPF